MAKMCPIKGCKEKEGMCIHEKIMIVIILAVIVFFIIKFIDLIIPVR